MYECHLQARVGVDGLRLAPLLLLLGTENTSPSPLTRVGVELLVVGIPPWPALLPPLPVELVVGRGGGGCRLVALPTLDSVLNRLVLDDANSPEDPVPDKDDRSRCGVPFDRDETGGRPPLSASELHGC
jgi:hypothetical protein